MPPLQKSRWEIFAQNTFVGKTAGESAKVAGYSGKTCYAQGSELLKNLKIQARIKELHELAASAKVMTVQERKERLSEIARARLTDFVECGPDGSWVNIGLETADSAAIQEIITKTEYDDNGTHPTVVSRVKLHDPVKALAELNKMEGAYAPVKADFTSKGEALQPQAPQIIVISQESHQLTQQILLGERTGNNGHEALETGNN